MVIINRCFSVETASTTLGINSFSLLLALPLSVAGISSALVDMQYSQKDFIVSAKAVSLEMC